MHSSKGLPIPSLHCKDPLMEIDLSNFAGTNFVSSGVQGLRIALFLAF
jgi:hypothetical protein